MKKLTAILMAVLMVVTMIPAMALVSSAAATEITLTPYGAGAETWNNKELGEYITQFVISHNNPEGEPTMKDIMDTIGYTGAHMEKNEETGEETLVAESATKGYFKLTITDAAGKVTTINKFVPRTNYNSGCDKEKELCIFRFDTCDKGLLIQEGNVYKIKLEVCENNGNVKYVGEVSGLAWAKGTGADAKGIIQGGKEVDSKFDTSKLYPVKGVEFLRYSGTDEATGMLKSDWEDHDNWKKALLVMIPKDKLVTNADAGAGVKAEIDLGNGKKLTATNNSNYPFESAILLRLECNEVPAEGQLYHATIRLYDESGKTLKYEGTCDISNGGVKDPNAYEIDPSLYPVTSTLTPYNTKEDATSHWEVWSGKLCLILVMDNIVNELDFKVGTVTATFDGKDYTDCLDSTAGLGGDGSKVVIRLDLGEIKEGEHKVSVTVATDEVELYSTEEITVKYNKAGTEQTGPNQGNTPGTNPSNPGTTQTGDGVVIATVAMAIALVAMAVVVKKIKA